MLLLLASCFVVIVIILQLKLKQNFPRIYYPIKCKLFALWTIFGVTIGVRGIYDIFYYKYVRKEQLSNSLFIA